MKLLFKAKIQQKCIRIIFLMAVAFAFSAALSYGQSPSASCSGIAPTCPGTATGSVSVTVSNPPSGSTTYLWSDANSSTSATVTGLAQGTYTVTVTFGNSSTLSCVTAIVDPEAIAISGSITNEQCYGESIGEIDLNVTGGTGLLSYNWSGGVTTEDRTGLIAGVYTVTVTDANLCASSASFTVHQPLAPLSVTATKVNPTCSYNTDGSITLIPAGGTAPYTYFWDDFSTSSDLSGIGLSPGTYSVTVTDFKGCSINQSYTLVNGDVTPPVISGCPSNITVTSNAGNPLTCSQTATWTAPTALDNCNGAMTFTTQSAAPGSSFPIGVSTVTYTFTDASNNTSTCTFTVTVVDNTAPVISGCPSNITVTSNAGNPLTCSQTATWTAPTALDNCNGAMTFTTQSAAPGSSFPIGVSTVTYTFTDASNNTSTCTFTVTVVDNTAPVISGCPSNITVTSNAGNPLTCSQTATWTAPTALDNCNGAMTFTTQSAAPGSSFPIGATTVTYTFTDASNNTSTCTFTVTVVDNTAPVISGCPSNITVTSNAGNPLTCSQTATWTAPTALDNCNGAMTFTTQSAAPGSSFPIGVSTVTYTFTDASNNTSTCTFTVTVVDNTAPVISGCPSNITVTSNAGNPLTCSQTATWTAPTALDNCNGAMTFTTQSAAPGSSFPIGATTVTYTFTDASNNTSTCTFTVTVVDNTAPVISGCPSNITVTSNAGNPLTCSQTATWTAPTALDNCNGAMTFTTQSAAPGSSFPIGATTVTYTFTDASNNTSTCTFTVTVVDNTAPVISGCPLSAVVVNPNNTGCSAIINLLAPAGTDNCDPSPLVTTPGGLTNRLFPLGNTTITWTITDANSNSSTCTQVITVTNSLTAICTFTNVSCKNGSNGTLSGNTSTGGTLPYTYSMNGVNYQAGQFTGLVAGTYTLYVKDANGCTSSCTTTITQPTAALSVAGVITNVVCKGSSTGAITITVSGGTGAGTYKYLWNNGSTDQNRSGLAAGVYSVTVTDNNGVNGCSVSGVFVLPVPGNSMVLSITKTNVRCGGKSTGDAIVSVVGGSGNFTYLWSPGSQTTMGISAQPAGTYQVLVHDETVGCTATKSVTITQNPIIILVLNNSIPNQLSASVTGGVPFASPYPNDYSYLWNPSAQTTPVITGLTTNATYKVKVTDSKGCTQIGSTSVSRLSATTDEPFEVSLYPNPSDGVVSLTFNTTVELKYNLKLYDMQGRLVFGKDDVKADGVSSNTYDFSKLPKGVYSIQVMLAHQSIKVLRIMLQ